MAARRWTAAFMALGAGLLCVFILRQARPGNSSLPLTRRLVRPANQRSPSEDALWQAQWYRMRAIEGVNQERYKVLERMPPEESAVVDGERWRRKLMAQDASGEVHHALTAARQALDLARTPTEEYRARVWLALITCDADSHQEELQHARRLVELKPENEVSQTSLRRAATCNHLWSLAREANAALTALYRRRGLGKPSAPYETPRVDPD